MGKETQQVELQSYTILKDKYIGKTAFIIGAGTSLYDCLQDHFFPEINKHLVITVNSSILAFNWSSKKEDKVWISTDSTCIFWSYWQRVLNANCIKIVRSSWQKYYEQIPDFLYFDTRPTSENIINAEDTGLCYSASLPAAIDLAIQMGVAKIFVLGLDHYFLNNLTSHFWQLWAIHMQPYRVDRRRSPHEQQQQSFDFNVQVYDALQKFSEVKNVKVYNCSPKSKVDAFEKISFDTALEMIK